MNKHPLIAVIGMDGIFPGALDLNAFWANIVGKVDQSAPAPEQRWIAPASDRLSDTLTPDRTYSRNACLINDFAFDPSQFNLVPEVSRQLDPVQQLTLTAGKRAVNACRTTDVDPSRVDTILAAIALPTDSASAFSRRVLNRAIQRRLFPDDRPSVDRPSRAEALASRVDGSPAALLAAEMGFGGTCFTLDAACASSIYAVKLSCDALSSRRADMVVTGGVSRPECLYTQTGFSQLQALSPSGRCAPFDHRADGLVVGEGVGILVLKRLDDAVEQGDTIHGVIHGIGLSNDMRGNLLAPESRGQVRAMQQAYASAGWRPSDVDLIECHGTGTRAGDTTEIESLMRLWQGEPHPSHGCAIGSVKSMIGHLLTAAGAAGMIKILLAMRHRTFPPSINFEKAPADSPLSQSPFRVQTEARPWTAPATGAFRRAAVSAFGFGGINAHILLEQGPSAAHAPPTDGSRRSSVSLESVSAPAEPVAIVGMDVCIGSLNDLHAFEKAIFEGACTHRPRPGGRWKGADDTVIDLLGGCNPTGGFIADLSVGVGQFQIPPNEIGDMLPQQLLALKTAAGALADAGLALREPRERMGVVFGMGFDLEATNFHIRWQLHAAIRRLNREKGLNLDPQALDRWLERLRDQCGPPLTPSRVMGALGGIVASRLAREFRFGGPSFVVAADASSGIHALQVAVDLIREDAVDAMLVGAVDMAGEARNLIRLQPWMPLSRTNRARPLDTAADGTLPADGGVSLVLKRLAQAKMDGDQIYAVVQGIGSARGGSLEVGNLDPSAYGRALERALQAASTATENVSYVETHATGIPQQDQLELAALSTVFETGLAENPANAVALGSTKSMCGYAGAADGLLSVAKTALCLQRRLLPPLPDFNEPAGPGEFWKQFHVPNRCQPWYRDRENGPRIACCSSVTIDGSCSHVLLQEGKAEKAPAPRLPVSSAGDAPPGIFAITGVSKDQLEDGLVALKSHLDAIGGQVSVETAAARWLARHPLTSEHPLAVALILKPDQNVTTLLDEARCILRSDGSCLSSKQVVFTDRPLGSSARIAWIYPGSGNHYLGMGRDLALRFPETVQSMDMATGRLKTQFRPWHLMPWRNSWKSGWEMDAARRLKSDPLNMIFGQVVFGSLVTGVLKRFDIAVDALIGYSLGESAALFAHGVWADRGDMLRRMQATDLFTDQLAGTCRSLRQSWHIHEAIPVDWKVAVVNRSAGRVREILRGIDNIRLLIVNTPDECVIGGLAPSVAKAITALNCQAVYLDGVVTVHCDAALPVAEAYRQLHHFPTTIIPGLTVYSCSWATAYEVTADRVADSIKKQAVDGFDFTQTIERAYADGCRVFLEAGPRSTCTRMIDRILSDQPHVAVAANQGQRNEVEALFQCLARLIAERIPVNLTPLYRDIIDTHESVSSEISRVVPIPVGGHRITPTLPETPSLPASLSFPPIRSDAYEKTPGEDPASMDPWQNLMKATNQNVETTAQVHGQFLDLSQELTRIYADTLDLQNHLLAVGAGPKGDAHLPPVPPAPAGAAESFPAATPAPAFDRDMCMEFAIGSVGRVLGPPFEEVDTYRVRVRLPDEPLMLVDRILTVEGEPLSLGSGRVITEHDVLAGAWYLDGDRAPVCISVEAGQADLFLSAYLGIDHQVKGQRAYRLLDAEVTFHRGLPRPGDTIRYEIAIDRFVRQGETWMFFFRFEGFIDGQHLITMRDGCAGFFTEEEVRNSGGIILTEAERRPVAGQRPPDWHPPVPMINESYSDDQVEALRRGDLAGCFGPDFAGIHLSESLHLPGGRMRLIHRILELDPDGGRYGLGLIRAEADIHPDDWFLTCHFVDDMVMPGTLMYECCAHTLRVFLQRMGWVADKAGVCYEPVIGNKARLKCRGPVTPATRHVHYEIQIHEIGFGPEPYVFADAHMFADDQPIVIFTDMSLQMTGTTRDEIEALWDPKEPPFVKTTGTATPIYDQASILAFATGNPSEAFGEPYRIFDSGRKIARLPGPPFCFMDRVIDVEPQPWQLEPGGWVTAQYDIPPAEWYFAADRSGVMPFCVLLEIALQPCGWLAAYAGSALRNERDLKFRNLGGSAVLHRQVTPHTGTLTIRCRLTKVSEAADMIIENFDFEVLTGSDPVYTGNTYFGFFSAEALSQQKGIGIGDPMVAALAPFAEISQRSQRLAVKAPMTPADAANRPAAVCNGLEMPGKALLMIDAIDVHLPDGSSSGWDYIRGIKQVDPNEWFFTAHFYQDPVCPGSLGLESFLQLMKTVAINRWPQLVDTHRFRLVENRRHNWSYRGQIIPTNKMVTVEAQITDRIDRPIPAIRASGLLHVDGLPIYKMENFELALVPETESESA